PGPRGVLVWFGLLNQAFVRHQPEKASATREDADAMALAALAGRPEVVALVSPVGEFRSVTVHPKGMEALSFLRARSELVDRLRGALGDTVASRSAESFGLLERLEAELVAQQRVLVWCVTHEGPGLPCPMGQWVDAPEWTR